MTALHYTIWETATGEIRSCSEVNSAAALPDEGPIDVRPDLSITYGASDPDRDRVDPATGAIMPKAQADLDALDEAAAARAVRERRFGRLQATVDSRNPIRWEETPRDMRVALRAYRRAWLDAPQTGVEPDPLPEPTALEAAKIAARERMVSLLDDMMDAAIPDVTLGEMLSWPRKEEAARRWKANTETVEDLALLNAEAAVGGDSLDDLTDWIIAQADAFTVLTGQIAGYRRRRSR